MSWLNDRIEHCLRQLCWLRTFGRLTVFPSGRGVSDPTLATHSTGLPGRIDLLTCLNSSPQLTGRHVGLQFSIEVKLVTSKICNFKIQIVITFL